MKKNKDIIYTAYKQSILKYKKKHTIYNINKYNKDLLDFLWKNNFLYGYEVSAQTSKINLFLKYCFASNIFNVKKSFLHIKANKLQESKTREKNTFMMIKTIKGIFNRNQALAHKIGGYLVYKFF